MTKQPPRASGPKPAEWRRWLGIGLRTLHLMGVVWMGAGMLATPMQAGGAGAQLTLASGVALLVSELADGRIALRELAGALVLAKLAAVAWMAAGGAGALPLFWVVMAVSAISSHAPRGLRHWRPGAGR
jgi:hypothetical protein